MSDSKTPIRGEDLRHSGIFVPGDLIAERFRVVREIDAGGMGTVYEAADTALDDEPVVLKTMLPKSAGDKSLLQRFRREAQYARRITHPNVCRTYDFRHHDLTATDESRRRVFFVTMELVRGQTLSAYLTKQNGRRLPVDRALPLIRQMASGLQAIHGAEIIHRDFKTSNVMLVESADGLRPVITDFGLARLVGSSSDDGDTETQLTATGQIVGNPETIAPEQITDGPVAFSTDIYAFGVVLYQMLTGHLPFSGSGRRLMMARLTESPAAPDTYEASLRGPWNEFLLRCLAREPQERFQTIREMLGGLPDVAIATTNPPAPSPGKDEIVYTLGPQQAGGERKGVSELMALFDHGLNAVIMCGAPATGKSELVFGFVRAMYRLRGRAQLITLPSYQTPLGGTPPGHVWFQPIDHKRVFVDPSGEFFTRLSPRYRERYQLPDLTAGDFAFIRRSVRQLVGIILTVDLTQEERGSEAPWRDQENDFRFLLPALRWLRFTGDERQETSLTANIQVRSARLPKLDVPVLVAFTKADLLNAHTHANPLEFAQRSLPTLHAALMTNVRRYRYDFCHTMVRTQMGDLPAETPCGVLLPFEWLLDPPFRWMPRLSTKGTVSR